MLNNMEKLNIDLEYCYGIKKLKDELNFNGHSSLAIYASNGMMKTSFAKTFRDLSEGNPSKDEAFGKDTCRIITDELDNEVKAEDVFVIERYLPNFTSKKIDTLLVNKYLKKKYIDLDNEINNAKNNLVKKLKLSSGITKIEEKVMEIFSVDQFFDIFETIDIAECDKMIPKFKDIKFGAIFNNKVTAFLNIPEIKTEIKEYIEKYDELLSKSKYLNQDFNNYNIISIQDELKKHNFFKAHHSINLFNESNTRENINEDDLKNIIYEEKQKIFTDSELEKRWNKIHDEINKKSELRDFSDYLFEHREIIPKLDNLDSFAKGIWMSYFGVHQEQYFELLRVYEDSKAKLEEIINKAKLEETIWKQVVEKFNKRFTLPLTITVENQEDVILKSVAPHTKFVFKNSEEQREIDGEKLKMHILSDGEQRALYHLNILFEIQTRIEINQKTLFIVDDIADSFDYKNKYAIIQYLKEISENPLFKLIILTHNFDFFRTIESRGIVNRKNCFSAYKSSDGEIKIEPTQGLRNIFHSLINHLDKPKQLIASIAFIRSLIENTKGRKDPDFIKLTSLLHWKQDTDEILIQDLQKIFKNSSINMEKFPTNNLLKKVTELIFEESDDCLSAVEGINFENKIVLSIGIRLRSERHMIKKIREKTPDFDLSAIKKDQTPVLIEEYRKTNPTEIENMEIFDQVGIMTPSNIHLNSFMYEPILDMSDKDLKNLYEKLKVLDE